MSKNFMCPTYVMNSRHLSVQIRAISVQNWGVNDHRFTVFVCACLSPARRAARQTYANNETHGAVHLLHLQMKGGE